MSTAPAGHGDAVLRRTPLYDAHVAAGATMVDFAGWSMPVKYTSDLDEHRAVRERVGMFDISHMADITVQGSDAGAFLDWALAGRLSGLAEMQSKYTMMLDESGGIIDDLIATRTTGDGGHEDDGEGGEYSIVANAANRGAVFTALQQRADAFGGDIALRDLSDANAIIAVQGPRALEVLQACTALRLMDGRTPFADTKYYRNTAAWFGDGAVRIARTGYTGEDGFELFVRAGDAVALWNALLEAGAPFGLQRCGLAARDTLRLEAGMPLYGHELSRDTKPVQAGLGWVVADKPDYVGKAGIDAGVPADAPVLVGLVAGGRRAGRAGYAVLDTDGAHVGEITSGALSPTLGHPIAMAYVHPRVAEPGTAVAMDVRGTAVPASVVAMPFYKRQQ